MDEIKKLENLAQKPAKKKQIKKTLEYVAEKSEQQRTTEKKLEFISVMDKAMGVIKLACDAVGVTRSTVYNWIHDDAKFRAEINRIQREQLGEVEDRLLKAIINGEGWAISLYLNRRHPSYLPKQKIINIPTEKTLEDLIEEYKNEKRKRLSDNNKPRIAGIVVQDTKQAGAEGEVRAEPGATVLLGAQDAPKSDIKSPAEGVK